MYVHLVCHWMILPTSFYLLAFKMDLGIKGLWMSKIILEVCIMSLYSAIIATSSWEVASAKAQERAKRHRAKTGKE